MRLLLDTHILLWSFLAPEKLSETAVSELENKENELWISPITTWEIIILAEKGHIHLKSDNPAQWIRNIYMTLPFKEAVLNHEVAIQSSYIDLPHQDPADRFIVASAKVYELTLITSDRKLLSLKEIDILKG